jgi:excisionase family DNA binding protein
MKNLNNLPDVLDVDHIKDILGVGRRQAYELANSNQFHVVRVGRRIKIAREVFENWLKGGQV